MTLQDKINDVKKILDEMIDRLYDEGVNVSYFPESAEQVIEQYAIKIAKICNKTSH